MEADYFLFYWIKLEMIPQEAKLVRPIKLYVKPVRYLIKCNIITKKCCLSLVAFISIIRLALVGRVPRRTDAVDSTVAMPLNTIV